MSTRSFLRKNPGIRNLFLALPVSLAMSFFVFSSPASAQGQAEPKGGESGGESDDTAMIIDEQGNVGIGTVTPEANLHVDGGNGGAVLKLTSAGKSISMNGSEISSEDSLVIRNPLGAIRLQETTGSVPSFIYSTTAGSREILLLRARTDASEGAGINLYGDGDSDAPGEIKFFTNGLGSRMTIKRDGKIGIGTSSPTATFDIDGSMRLRRVSSAPDCTNSIAGTILHRQKSGENSELFFCQRAGGARWRQLDTTGNTPDLAEYFPAADLEATPGDLVAISTDTAEHIVRATAGESPHLLGAISTEPGEILGTHPDAVGPNLDTERVMHERGFRAVALAGRIPVKVMITDEPIKNGAPIVLSSLAGIGQRAAGSAYSLGFALESFYPHPSSCHEVSQLEEIEWEVGQELTWERTQQCYRLPDGTLLGKITVFINPGWHEAPASRAQLLSRIETLERTVKALMERQR